MYISLNKLILSVNFGFSLSSFQFECQNISFTLGIRGNNLAQSYTVQDVIPKNINERLCG